MRHTIAEEYDLRMGVTLVCLREGKSAALGI